MASLVVGEEGNRSVYDLREGANPIGRHPDNLVAVMQPSVSGKHAIIHGEKGQFVIEDAGSRNGTYVNRQKITSRVKLSHSDVLLFGDVVARFEQPESVVSHAPVSHAPVPEAQPSSPQVSPIVVPVQPLAPAAARTPSTTAGTLGGAISDAATFDDDTEGEMQVTAQTANQGRFGVLDTNPEAKLKAVLEISKSLAGQVDLEQLLPTILDTLFRIFIYADRGCILLKNDRTGELVPRAMKHRRGGQDATVRLSRTIINKILKDKCGIMSANASMDAAFRGSESIADLKIRSVMCVPLLGLDGEAIGVLSIDSQNLFGQFSQDDLEILMTVAGQAALAYENARLMQSYAQKLKQDGELEIAKSVQRALLPTEFPCVDGYEFFASYDAAQAVGGDYYDTFRLPDGKVVLSFGDVAGKGVPGALIMSRMSSCVQSTIRHVHRLNEAMCAINDHMCDTAVEGRFVTYILAIVDPKTHSFELSNAGHMSPIIRRANGSVDKFDEDLVGPPIGVVDGYPYECESKMLEPGDLVVLVTDGVDEAMNHQGELYGADRLLEFVRKGPVKADELGRALLADVRRHASGRAQNDDITIMTFGRNPS